MPSDDEDQSSDNELDNIREHFRNIPGITVAQVQHLDVVPQENSNSESIDNEPPRFFAVSPPHLPGSSASLEIINPLDTLFTELALVTRHAADVLSTQYNMPEPGQLLDRILNINAFLNEHAPQTPSLPSSSTAIQSPSSIPPPWDNILSDEYNFSWANSCASAIPQIQGSQPIHTVAAFFIIILIILSRHQYPYNFLNFPF